MPEIKRYKQQLVNWTPLIPSAHFPVSLPFPLQERSILFGNRGVLGDSDESYGPLTANIQYAQSFAHIVSVFLTHYCQCIDPSQQPPWCSLRNTQHSSGTRRIPEFLDQVNFPAVECHDPFLQNYSSYYYIKVDLKSGGKNLLILCYLTFLQGIGPPKPILNNVYLYSNAMVLCS